MIASEPRHVQAADGYSLSATIFRPPGASRPERVVLVCSAMGVRQTYYFDFAEYVAGRGLLVITFDYRGIGSSAPKRLSGFHADLEDWGALDIAAMIAFVRETFGDARLSVVAHSVGGQVLGLAPNCGEVQDLLAVGAQSGYWGHWSGNWRVRVWLLWYVFIPLLTRVMGHFPSRLFGLGRNIPRDVARRWAYWGRHPEYVLGRVAEDRREGYSRFAGRMRAVTASDDTIAPPAAVRAMLGFYPAAQREFRLVQPEELGVRSIGHFGYFRESVGRDLWKTEVDWIDNGPN